eukprot:m.1142210 g.1142210  ORF g.1142210 m.1142210 type:complete len:673 (-) comp24453_c0_seq16:4226-6244(-)
MLQNIMTHHRAANNQLVHTATMCPFWLVCLGMIVSATLGRDMVPSGKTVIHVCPSIEQVQSDTVSQIHEAETLHHAQEILRSLRSSGVTGHVVIELCSSVAHTHYNVLDIDERDTSLHGDTIIRGQTAKDGAVIDSGMVLRGWIVNNTTGLWEAPLPAGAASRQLWINGVRAPRAHANPEECSGGPPVSPSLCTKTLKQGTITPTGYNDVPDPQTNITASPLAQWLPGAEFVYGKGASGASWTEPRCTVASVAPGSKPGLVNIIMEQPCWQRAIGKAQNQRVTFPSDIENSLALLTEPMEWYADFAPGKKIYYMPRPEDDIKTVSAILGSVPTGGQGEAIRVAASAHRVTFASLVFHYQTWMFPSSPTGFVDLQSGFYSQAGSGRLHGVPGALSMHGTKNARVYNCTFQHLGLSGFLADAGAQNITVDASTFHDISGSAVLLGNVSDPIQSAEQQDGPFTIISNTIENIAVEYHGCAGICAGYVANTDIVHNQLTNTSNGAICLGWGWGANNTMHNNRVNYNHIVRSNTELYDCGSIYTLSSQPNSEVAYNYIENQVLRFGSLYHDARSAHFHTHHNVVVGGPMWLYLQWGPLGPVDNILVENNYHNQTVAGGCATPQHADTCQATGFCPTKYSPCGNVTIQNNTVVDGDTWPAEAVAIEHQAGPLPQHNLL